MPVSRHNGSERLRPRRWSFADCVFDESNWTLTVSGQRVAVETKPLEMLRELLLRAGKLVSKEELLDMIWPDVAVVEASLPTAIRKLRRALNDDERETHIIETVQGIGYRLTVPVEMEDLTGAPSAITTVHRAASDTDRGDDAANLNSSPATRRLSRLAAMAAVAAIAIAGILATLAPSEHLSAQKGAQSFTRRDAANALRKLDVATIERMIAAGWDPNTPFDNERNGAVNYLLNMCEWNRGHDRQKMLLLVRTLFEAGARVTDRNVWGDTPYSIAKAPRYCGPNHPVTKMMRTMCTEGPKPLGDRCLASYELARREKVRHQALRS